MLTAINKYPFFDITEIISDNDLELRSYNPLYPVKTGNYIPDLQLNKAYANWQQFYNGSETHGPVLLRHLLEKPLVISFYSHHWKNIGLEQLKSLNSIQHEIKASGGNLLIITSEKEEGLQAKAWEHNLSLNFYYDKDNSISRQFRVFGEDSPAWERFSGIDENAPLPATYIIDNYRQIVFDHIDLTFEAAFPAKEIISSVYVAALISNSKKSA